MKVSVFRAEVIHAVMTRTKAGERTRQFDSEEFPFFYNPMWSLFGDRTHGPAGTYYAGPDGAVSYSGRCSIKYSFGHR